MSRQPNYNADQGDNTGALRHRIAALEAENAELRAALTKLIAQFDSEIHNEYDGTSMLEDRLAEADYARAALKETP